MLYQNEQIEKEDKKFVQKNNQKFLKSKYENSIKKTIDEILIE